MIRCIGEHILDEMPDSRDTWKINQSLEGAELGNFVWKRRRNFLIRLIPLFEKYYDVTTSKKLKDFLIRPKDDGPSTFQFKTDIKKFSFPAKSYKYTQRWTAGFKENVLGITKQDSESVKIPALDLIRISINIAALEEDLTNWELNMNSPYIKEKERKKDIPCIINGIFKHSNSMDQTVTMVSETGRRIEGSGSIDPSSSGTSVDVSDKVSVKANNYTSVKKEGVIKGTILYSVLPLEVHSSGKIEAKEDFKGFLEDRVVSDSLPKGNFSGTCPDPTLDSSFNEVEQLLQPVIKDQLVAEAFRSISNEDIHYLCSLFERVQESPQDVEEPNKMSPQCEKILLFAQFRRQEPDKLLLKEKFQFDRSFTGCYYLASVLAEVPTQIRHLVSQTTVNLFPLLKSVLLTGRPQESVINDDILKCKQAMELLEKLDISTKGSAGTAIPTSQDLLVNVAWIAMLYGRHTCSLDAQE